MRRELSSKFTEQDTRILINTREVRVLLRIDLLQFILRAACWISRVNLRRDNLDMIEAYMMNGR